MIAVLQRVTKASVTVQGEVAGKIGRGLMVLFAVCEGDRHEEMTFLCDKMANLRIFPDDEGKMNRSLLDINAEILFISQFTLCADWIRGRRPGFTKAAAPELAEASYLKAIEYLRQKGINVESGSFGSEMKIDLTNDGPVTLILDSKEKFNK